MGTHRVQLDLTPTEIERLQSLKRRTGAMSYTEVFRHALIHYELAVDHTMAKSTLMFVSPDGQRVKELVGVGP